jgi:thiol-disulfide isomerase/thioredoxin
MKNILVFLLFVPFFSIAQKGFEINGYLKGLGDNKVRIFHIKNNKTVLDTISSIEKDHFIFKGVLEEPELIRIDVIDTTQYLRIGKAVSIPPPITLMLTNASVEINGDAKEIYKASVKSNDPEMIIYETYRKDEISNIQATWDLQKINNQKLKESDSVGSKEVVAQLRVLRVQNQQMRIKFIDGHPKSFASALMLNNLSLVMSVGDMKKRFDGLDSLIKSSKFGKSLNLKIESNLSTAVGKPVIPVSQVGYDGKLINTGDLIGKVIIIDFWGSWCVPCRRSHPGLKNLYAKYHSKGLEIIGIANEGIYGEKSKEEQIKAWQKAIKEDSLPWLQLLNDAAINDYVKRYDIAGYPTKFVIDKNGKFALRLLGAGAFSEVELEKKIVELLAN